MYAQKTPMFPAVVQGDLLVVHQQTYAELHETDGAPNHNVIDRSSYPISSLLSQLYHVTSCYIPMKSNMLGTKPNSFFCSNPPSPWSQPRHKHSTPTGSCNGKAGSGQLQGFCGAPKKKFGGFPMEIRLKKLWFFYHGVNRLTIRSLWNSCFYHPHLGVNPVNPPTYPQ